MEASENSQARETSSKKDMQADKEDSLALQSPQQVFLINVLFFLVF